MDKTIRVKQGLLEGVPCDGYTVFKGIPYAKPPVGELRWKAPQEAEPWTGIYKADHFPATGYQELPKPDHPFMKRYHKEFYNDPNYIPALSEDCLYLNIWVPEHTEETRFPVAFWIHGGGFAGGYSSELEFDGEAYCKKGVILVTIEYRMNIYGFLAHPWLDAENEKGISGNYGILDQIAALKWVHENIAAFGGDPDNITVFGQSAGCMSTQVLVSSELTGNIPTKAIFQSGISCENEFLYTPTLEEEEKIGEMFVECAGVSNIQELRAMTPEQIRAAGIRLDARTFSMGKGIVLVPNVDGYVLKENVRDVWKQGKMKKIPYMTGAVIDDLGSAPEEIKAKKGGLLIRESVAWCLKCEELGMPGYIYYFPHELPGDDWGSFHSAELWYMFGTLKLCWRPMTDADHQLSEEMVTCWTNFMKTGIPASSDTEPWETYTREHPFVREFR